MSIVQWPISQKYGGRMNKILILSSNCYGKTSANGLCALSIRNALINKGFEVDILGFIDDTGVGGNQGDGEYDIGVSYKECFQKQNRCLFGKIANLFSLTFKKPINQKVVKLFYEKTLSLSEKKQYDVIIAMYFLPELVEVGRRIKQTNQQIKFLIYEVDSSIDGINVKGLIQKISNHNTYRWLKRNYKIADAVFALRCHEKYIKKNFFKELVGKLVIVDLPLLQKKNTIVKKSRSGAAINLFYTGLLDSNYRSPNKMLEIFKSSSITNLFLHFYSYGNCESIIRQESDLNSNIIQHGQVPSTELEKKMEDADLFINIGNSNSNSLPSKLVTYISCCKPIIHIKMQEKDICVEYLNKYPLALIIDPNSSYAVKSFDSFILDNIGKNVEYDLIEKIFDECTPEFSAGEILKKIMELNGQNEKR